MVHLQLFKAFKCFCYSVRKNTVPLEKKSHMVNTWNNTQHCLSAFTSIGCSCGNTSVTASILLLNTIDLKHSCRQSSYPATETKTRNVDKHSAREHHRGINSLIYKQPLLHWPGNSRLETQKHSQYMTHLPAFLNYRQNSPPAPRWEQKNLLSTSRSFSPPESTFFSLLLHSYCSGWLIFYSSFWYLGITGGQFPETHL